VPKTSAKSSKSRKARGTARKPVTRRATKAAPRRAVKATHAPRPAPRAGVKKAPAAADKPGSASAANQITPSKAALASSPLKPADLRYFEGLLRAKRRELLGDVASMEQEALNAGGGSNLSNLPIHMADMGTDSYEQEFTLGLVEKDRQLLREIDLALDKIKKGTYGICEGTGKPISRVRLEAKPWARHSLEYTLKLEKGLVRR
jgi:DnaK suppressor protein